MRAILDVKLPSSSGSETVMTIQDRHKSLAEMGLAPTDLPSVTWLEPGGRDKLQDFFRTRAEPIFDRMPDNSPEEKKRKQFAQENIVYASELADSSTDFM